MSELFEDVKGLYAYIQWEMMRSKNSDIYLLISSASEENNR